MRTYRTNRRRTFRGCVIWAAIAGLTAAAALAHAQFPPPENAQIHRIGGKTCYSGEIYLPSHADTAGLSGLGFQILEFRGRSVGTVRYGVVWPVSTDLRALPSVVSGLNYDETAAAEPSEELDSDEDRETLEQDITEAFLSEVRRRSESERTDETVPNSKRYYLNREGKLVPLELSSVDRAILRRSNGTDLSFADGPELKDDLSMRGVFFTSPSDARSIRKVNEVGWRHPDLTTTFHTNPVEGGPFHTPQNVPGMRDADVTGTYIFEPVEKGPFHKIENVTTRDSRTCGNFTITPYSTLRKTGIGSTEWYQKPFGTGSFIGGVPNDQPRDGWRGVGFRSFPVSHPSQYSGSIRTPDSRNLR